jgi:hypothetical protein
LCISALVAPAAQSLRALFISACNIMFLLA